MAYLQVAFGLILLFAGAEVLVRGAVSLARRAGLSPLLIGMTIVAFATSAPELVVSIEAAAEGAPGIAVGNIVGSNIVNIGLGVGLAALVAPLAVGRDALWRETAAMIAASVLMPVLALTGLITGWQGVLMVAVLVSYTAWSYMREKRCRDAACELHERESDTVAVSWHPALAAIAVVASVAVLAGGSRILLIGAVVLARDFGMSDAVIGLTLVAAGTSLPEIATSVVAAFRREQDVAIGNIVGSNIFNVFGILGLASIVRDLPIDPAIARFDVWAMLGFAVLSVPYLLGRRRIGRREGTALLALYSAFVLVTAGVISLP
ncbi:MAG: calcium/sodium antiporter [Coriobacteriia bacterium]